MVVQALIFVGAIVCLAGLVTFAMGRISPDHPPLIDAAVWVVVAVVALFRLAALFGGIAGPYHLPVN